MMTEADKPGFVAALAELSLLRPAGLKLSEAHYGAWWNAMRRDWTLPEFQAACATIAQQCDDMVIGPQHFAQLRKAAQPTPAEAWTLVRQTLRTMHPHDRVTLGDRIDRVVLAMGGYQHLGMTNSDQMHFREKRFAELWDELGTADEVRKAIPSLDSTNRLSGPQRGAVPQVTRQ